MEQSERDRIDKITEVVHYLLKGVQVPQIQCSSDPDDEIKQLAGKVNQLTDLFLDINNAIKPLANGQLDQEFKSKILFLAPFKQLQAHLRHLTWQTKQIAKGNFDIRVDFMGDFSESFNSMVACLDKAQTEVKAAQKAKGQFLANMSHEIRTPMNAIIGFIDLARSESATEKRDEYLYLAASSGEHLLAIINDILDFSKAEAEELILEAIDFDLHRMVCDTMRMVSQKAKSKGLETFCFIDEEIKFYVEGDPTRLRQILINLLGNAIKFTRHGSVGIRVAMVEDQGEKKVLQFRIEDTGIGIAEDKKDLIFNSFSQADLTTTRVYGGTGLGLAICKRFIEKMGGRIWIESLEGLGSSFIFDIPFRAKESIVHQQIQPIPRKALSGKRVLIIDDDRETQQLLQTICTGAGMNVVASVSFEQWSRRHTQPSYDDLEVDLILLGLQNMNGHIGAIAKPIKISKNLKHAKVVVLCTEPRKGDAKKARDKSIDAYISKPVTKNTLISVIATALGDARSNGPIATRHMADELSCKGIHILLAEDNLVNVKLMEILLGNLGCTFDIVADGEAACRAVKKNDYDIVLMDVHMPNMNGIDATNAIRKEINHQVPIIALTAAAMQEDKTKCFEAGMDDIVLKPVNIGELKEKLCIWAKRKDSVIKSSSTCIGQSTVGDGKLGAS
jgi:signal transduction histidine kinase/DNA-binding response OmpR family regulator